MDRPEYSLLEIAQKYRAAGLNVLPADKKKKRPIGRWKEWTKAVGDFDSRALRHVAAGPARREEGDSHLALHEESRFVPRRDDAIGRKAYRV